MAQRSLEQIAYEAYAAHQGWNNAQGMPLAPWDDLREDIKQAWHAVVIAVNTALIDATSEKGA